MGRYHYSFFLTLNVLNPMFSSFYVAREYYRFSQRGWAHFRCISNQFGRTKFCFACLSLDVCILCVNPAPRCLDIKNCASMLGPVFKEKWSRKSGSLFQTRQQCSRACSYCLKHPARACSDCLALTKLTCLGEPRYFYGGKLARLGGRPCHRKREKQQARRVDPSSRANFCLPC